MVNGTNASERMRSNYSTERRAINSMKCSCLADGNEGFITISSVQNKYLQMMHISLLPSCISSFIMNCSNCYIYHHENSYRRGCTIRQLHPAIPHLFSVRSRIQPLYFFQIQIPASSRPAWHFMQQMGRLVR